MTKKKKMGCYDYQSSILLIGLLKFMIKKRIWL